MCPHRPPCPPADSPDRAAAHAVACHPEQGWSLLCNRVIVFDDMGELLPDGRVGRRTARHPSESRQDAPAAATEARALPGREAAPGWWGL